MGAAEVVLAAARSGTPIAHAFSERYDLRIPRVAPTAGVGKLVIESAGGYAGTAVLR